MISNRWHNLAFAGLFSIMFVTVVFTTSVLALEGKAGEVIKTVEDLKELEAKGLLTLSQVIGCSGLIRDFGCSIPILKTLDRRQERTVSKTYLKATQMHKGKAGIGPDGEILNYGGAGLPFPDVSPDDPQAGVKGAWNFNLRHNGGDDIFTHCEYPLTDNKGFVKDMGINWSRLLMIYRTDVAPTPNLYPASAGDVWYKELAIFDKPFASKGLGQLTVRPTDTKVERSLWIYVPGLRRVTRVGGGNRCDCLGGLVINMDDLDIWTGDTTQFNWKLLGVKEHLGRALTPVEDIRQGKYYIRKSKMLKIELERRVMWVIEQTPKDPNYCYGKRIFYLDPESWFFLWADVYTQTGELWKFITEQFDIFPNPEKTGGGWNMVNLGGDTVDYRIGEAGPSYSTELRLNAGAGGDSFTMDHMRRGGR